jgi:hypothetical protein
LGVEFVDGTNHGYALVAFGPSYSLNEAIDLIEKIFIQVRRRFQKLEFNLWELQI